MVKFETFASVGVQIKRPFLALTKKIQEHHKHLQKTHFNEHYLISRFPVHCRHELEDKNIQMLLLTETRKTHFNKGYLTSIFPVYCRQKLEDKNIPPYRDKFNRRQGCPHAKSSRHSTTTGIKIKKCVFSFIFRTHFSINFVFIRYIIRIRETRVTTSSIRFWYQKDDIHTSN